MDTAASGGDPTEAGRDTTTHGAEQAHEGTVATGTDTPVPEAATDDGAQQSAVDGDSGPSETQPGELIEEPEPDELVDDGRLDAVCEALLLVVDTPIDEASLAETLRQPTERVATALHRLSERYTAAESGIDLRRVGEGWRFYTRDVYAPYVERLLLEGQRAKLTRAALETLAVIAYRQPVTRSRVAAVRGVNVDGVVRTLLTRGLIEEVGADTETGGTLYRTTELFLERLGLSSLDDLPAIAPLLPEVDSIDELD